MVERVPPGSRQGAMPFQKYKPFAPIDLSDRKWPSRVLTHAPRWCSVDLRDGNQALVDPMNVDEKLRMFELLLEIGFVEIEVGFPAASQPDFDFIRRIIDNDMIPDGVHIQFLCQARKELIDRTIEAIDGAPNAIFHLYNSTSELQRRVVFNMDRLGIIGLAVEGTGMVRQALAGLKSGQVSFEYSPESFTGTELDFAVEICEAVVAEWGGTKEEPVIINLPSTVEMSTPNVYADQIEYFCRQFNDRDKVLVSLHTHNDRGTGIAATELAIMAGAERVEGTLFGNGERTGNCDIVNVAMNLFSQGVDPQLDLRDMPRIRNTVEEINKLPIGERHPYAGDLVFTAFSGSHQDAIKKGMAIVDRKHWEVPYLPIDPEDVGSSYKEAVRVNSQSGKGGIGFILEEYYGVILPRTMLVEFSKIIQELTEKLDREIQPDEIFKAFIVEYVVEAGPYRLVDYDLSRDQEEQRCDLRIEINESQVSATGVGTGPIEAFVNGLVAALNEPFNIMDYHEHAVSAAGDSVGKDGSAVCLLAIEGKNSEGPCYGVGMSKNTITASLLAIVSAMNRRWSRY